MIIQNINISDTVLFRDVSTAASSSALIEIDAGNPSSYSGTGTAVISVGTQGGIIGTMSGVTYDSGTASGVFTFDGGSDLISFSSYDFGSVFSLMAWVKPSEEFSINTIFANGGAGGQANGFKLGWNNWNTTDHKMWFEGGDGSSGGSFASNVGVVTMGDWQHLAYVFNRDAQTVAFYRNGQVVPGTGTVVSNINTNSDWNLGAFLYGSFYMNSQLGKLQIFNTALTVGDVFTEYDTTKSRYGL